MQTYLSAKILQDGNFDINVTEAKAKKQVRTNNDAAFQCNFHFNIFFILWITCTIDFKFILLDFAKKFAIFIMLLQMYGWMDG